MENFLNCRPVASLVPCKRSAMEVWAYFLKLVKRFQIYRRFSVPKKGDFVDKS